VNLAPDALRNTKLQTLKPNSQNILGHFLGQFYDILHTDANVLIHKTSYDNFTTKILPPLFRCLMTIEISDISNTTKLLFIDS